MATIAENPVTIDPSIAALGMEMHIQSFDIAIEVRSTPPALIEMIEEVSDDRMQDLLGEAASSDPVIAKIRAAFKTCGKDPSRYRPSSEALTRRIIAGKPLYHVNNVVDCGNLISLMTGIPVGCYDATWIKGDLTLRVGKAGETYETIGRGSLNLEGLPVLADANGPFGTPFSDSAHTAVTETTRKVKFITYGLNISDTLTSDATHNAHSLLRRFCAID
ncbi:MAG: hypothetical protein JKY60_11905 [Kordiimonadaceae bacterium]|nr:hypothetical protein [Kordiimonadaceae bacterium]